jgi:hypothetical protein
VVDSSEDGRAPVTDSPAQRARASARNCESAGLTSEADVLYRLSETLENQDQAA